MRSFLPPRSSDGTRKSTEPTRRSDAGPRPAAPEKLPHRAIVRRAPDGRLTTLASFVKPITTDNYEGLALREDNGRTFLYMISDDNFKVYDKPDDPANWQHTYLMKFEVAG